MKKVLSIVLSLFCIYSVQAQLKYPSILWEIKKPNSNKVSYLLGTYHVSSKGVFKLADSIFYALKSVDMVGTELNYNTWQQEDDDFDKMKNTYNIFNTVPTDVVVDQELLRKTNTVAKLPVFISFQPNSINYFLYRNRKGDEDFEEEAYLDRFIASTGYKFGKKIVGLENFMESNVSSIKAYKNSLKEEKKTNLKLPDGLSYDQINDLIYDGYKNNNLDIMDSLDKYNYESEAYFKEFIIKRNYNQADSIDAYIKMGNNIFAAVGSAHLPGVEGVIEILRQKGYKLRPVKLSGHDKDRIETIKKTIFPFKMNPYSIDNNYKGYAPGPMYQSFANPLLKIYNYVDMPNGGYYIFARAYNNTFYFGLKGTDVLHTIDSLLYENTSGDIISRKQSLFQGYPCIDVVSKVKNKDIEKYRYIVTPYEILKLKVGGKNEYANQANVDSFFNNFSINTINNNWHVWKSEFLDKAQYKTRYTQFESDKNIMNGVLKISLNNRKFKKNDDYLKLAVESFTSSVAINKNEQLKVDFTNLTTQKIYDYKLENGGTIAVQYKFIKDNLIVFYSASNKESKPNTDWFATFNSPTNSSNKQYVYKDSLKCLEVTLPYALSFDASWKAATEMNTDKPDDDKKVNRNSALEYAPENISRMDKSYDVFSFQNPEDAELVWTATVSIDSNYYYQNAKLFWDNFILKSPKESQKRTSVFNNRNSYYDNYSRQGSDQLDKTNYVLNITYDTTNLYKQQLSFDVADSLTNKILRYTYIMNNNKINYFIGKVDKSNNSISDFYKNILQSFKPFNNNKKTSVYEPKLLDLVKKYTTVKDKTKADISDQLNYLHFSANNTNEADEALELLKTKSAGNNILRKKIIEAFTFISNPNDKEWNTLSDWYKKIYENKNELLTIRFSALREILFNAKSYDLPWVLQNIKSNEEFKTSASRYALASYFEKLQNKKEVASKINLSIFGTPNTNAYVYKTILSLYDSGFYNKKQMLNAFNEIEKNTADQKVSLALKAEADQFKYAEDEKKKSSSINNYNETNNFTYYTEMFDIFYSSLKEEPFFEENFKKIVQNGTAKDKLNLLEALLKQKDLNTDWCNQILESIKTEKNYYFDIYKAYLFYNKLSSLPDMFNDKTTIAKVIAKGTNSYNQPDTIYHLQTIVSPYNENDSVYFFMYRNKNEKNEEVAFTILPKNAKFSDLTVDLDFKMTPEQITKTETFDIVSKRLLRKHYINKIYNKGNANNNNNYGFYQRNLDEKSLDVEE